MLYTASQTPLNAQVPPCHKPAWRMIDCKSELMLLWGAGYMVLMVSYEPGRWQNQFNQRKKLSSSN